MTLLDYRNPMHGPTPRRPKDRRTVVGWSVGVLVALVLVALILTPSFDRRHVGHNRTRCASHLRQIGVAAILYASVHGGRLPPDLPTLLQAAYIPAGCFTCPSSGVDEATGATTQEVVASLLAGGRLSYAWTGGGLTTATTSADVVLAFDLERHVPKGGATTAGINVMLGDASVTFVDEATAAAIRARFVAGVRPIRLSACAMPTAALPAASP